METYLSSPSMVLLCAAALFIFGLLCGWLLRANVREKELNAEISKLRLDLQSSTQQYETTKEELNLSIADNRKANLEAEQFAAQLKALQATAAQPSERIDAPTESSAAQAAATTKALETQIADLEYKNLILTKENDIFREQLDNMQDSSLDSSKSQSDNLLLEETIVRLEKERNQAIDEADEMASLIATMRQELTKADSDTALLKVQLTRMENELLSANTEMTRLQAQEQDAVPSAATGESSGVSSENSKEAVILKNMLEDDSTFDAIDTADFDAADALLSSFGGLRPIPTTSGTSPHQVDDATIAEIEALAEIEPEVEETLEEPAHTATPLHTDAPTDLKVINGIGEKFEERLHAMGITTFQQIATLDTDAALLQAVQENLRVSEKRIQSEEWAAQARHLLENEQMG